MLERDNVKCLSADQFSADKVSHGHTLVTSPYVSQESHEDSHISVFGYGFGIRALFQSKYIVYC